MREWLRAVRESDRAAKLYGILALAVTLHYLIVYLERYLIWSGHEPMFNALRALHAVLICVMLALFALKLTRGFPPETWLLAAFCGWMLITRLINRDYTLYGSLYFSAVCVGVFAAGFYLRPGQRRRMLDVFAAIVGGYLFLVSAMGLLVWFGGKDSFPVIARFISNNPFSGVKNIVFFNTVHNMSAAWFAVSLFLSAYEWKACKDRRWRIPIALHMAMMFVVIGLQHCRSIQVACSVGAGMLAVLAVLPRLTGKKLPIQIAAVTAIAVLGLLLCFKGLSLCGDAFVKGLKVSQSEVETYLAEQAEIEKLLSEEEKAAYAESRQAASEAGADSRSFLRDALTLTERTDIWKAAFKLMREDRHAALFGQREETMMEAVNSRGNYIEVKQHTHNLFIQAMVLTGIPGALLLLAFVCLQLFRMVRGYFDASGKMRAEDKVLLVLPAVLLVYGMAEVLLNRLVGFASLSYLLSAGIYTEFYREAFKKIRT